MTDHNKCILVIGQTVAGHIVIAVQTVTGHSVVT